MTEKANGPQYDDVVREVTAPPEVVHALQDTSPSDASLRRIATTAEGMAQWTMLRDRRDEAFKDFLASHVYGATLWLRAAVIFNGVIALALALLLWVR